MLAWGLKNMWPGKLSRAWKGKPFQETIYRRWRALFFLQPFTTSGVERLPFFAQRESRRLARADR